MSTGQNRLELFADNAQVIRNEFTWQEDSSRRLAALLYALEGKAVDCDAIRQCHALIKQNTGVFSSFRGTMAICVATMLSLSPNPQDLLDETLKVYDLLKEAKLRDSDFLVMAAYQIAAQANACDYGDVVARIRSFLDGMNARHSHYTGKDDYILAAMLGLSDLDVDAGVERIEQFFNRLKGEFRDRNSVQALAQVLALCKSDDIAADRILALREALRAQRIKLDRADTLPVLGILALLPVEIDEIVRDLGAAQVALKARKGFGALSVDTGELLLLVASILASDYVENEKIGMLVATLSASVINMVITQHAAMVVIIAATVAS